MKRKNSKNDDTVVQMLMRPPHLKKVNELKTLFKTNTRAGAVRAAIVLTHLVTTKIQDGYEVIFEPSRSNPFQKRQRLVVPPLNS